MVPKGVAGVLGAFHATLAEGEGKTVLESGWAKVVFHNCVLSRIAANAVC